MKNLTLFALLSLILILPLSAAQRREPICELVHNPVFMDFSIGESENPYDNGYKKERYHYVLDKVIETFNPRFSKMGQVLKILRDWGDGAVNAWAFRVGDEAWLEVPGGMARYHLISEEGFLMTICHELGHLIGGYPHRNEISYEGQSDYFAPMKCMEDILLALKAKENLPTSGAQFKCVGKFCQQRMVGIRSLTSYYAFLEKVPNPSLSTPSSQVVRQTSRAHPPAQCRFDTMVRALGCSNRSPFSYSNEIDGACLDSSSRAKCWYRN
jgi:hypothetical protein